MPAMLNFAVQAALAGVSSLVATATLAWTIEPLGAGLEVPWAVAPLPKGGMLVSERDGRLLSMKGGVVREIAGVPRVAERGQGGRHFGSRVLEVFDGSIWFVSAGEGAVYRITP